MSVNPNNNSDDYYAGSTGMPDPPLHSRIQVNMAAQRCDAHHTPQSLRDDFESSFFPSEAEMKASAGERLMELIMLHGNVEALMMLDRLFIRYQMKDTPIDEIAKELNVSTTVTRRLYTDFKQRQMVKVQQLDSYNILGRALDEISMVNSELANILTDGTASKHARVSAGVAIQESHLKQAKLLDVNGFYKGKQLNPMDDDQRDAADNARTIITMINNTFDAASYSVDPNSPVDPEESSRLLGLVDQWDEELKSV